MTTVYLVDPVRSLEPYTVEQAVVEAAGATWELGDREHPEIHDAEVILTTGIRVPPDVIRGLTRCRMIARYGIGVDTIDIGTATECGIVVCNAPTYCVNEVADHTAALILSFTRRIPWLDDQVRAGNWAEAHRTTRDVHRLSRQTLGIIGLGKIGRQVAWRMAPFGFQILGYDPAVDAEEFSAFGVTSVALDELLSASDIVSLHVPLMPQTRHLIDARRLGLMKPTATLINTSRGPVVDEGALVAALQHDRLWGAALDVLEIEPPAPDHPLLAIDPQRVVLTPHFASSSAESLVDLKHEIAAAVTAILADRWPAGTMNPHVVAKRQLHYG